MSTLHKHEDIDSESGSCNNGVGGSTSTADGGAVTEGGGSEGRRLSEAKEIVRVLAHERRESGESECSVEIVDLGNGGDHVDERKLHLGKRDQRDCRICHLSMDAANQESGFPIELGCSCKDDLAAAHQHCAEAWFQIKGNKTCEICGSIAQNVGGANEAESAEEQSNEAAAAVAGESRNFWQGHRFLNFLLACMVFAFVISWLFHFNAPS